VLYYSEDGEMVNSFHKVVFKVKYPKVDDPNVIQLFTEIQKYENMDEINLLNKI
jgi:hypothetical protein